MKLREEGYGKVWTRRTRTERIFSENRKLYSTRKYSTDGQNSGPLKHSDPECKVRTGGTNKCFSLAVLIAELQAWRGNELTLTRARGRVPLCKGKSWEVRLRVRA